MNDKPDSAGWVTGVPTSGFSYLVHLFERDTAAVYSSKCGQAASKHIDSDPALLAISERCKRCFKEQKP